MSNNPISNVDPNGDSPVLIGAAIGFLSNGIQNVASGNNFFQGGLRAAALGAWGGGISSGIGQAFGNVSGFGNELMRAGAHGYAGGVQSMAGGGSFGSGFLSGSISSGVGSGIDALGGGATAQWAGGGLSGGLGSVIGGGNFFQGAGMGLIVGGLNHAAEHLFQGDPPGKENFVPAKDRPKVYEEGYIDWVNRVPENTTISYTLKERLYLLGKYAGLTLPTARVRTLYQADDFVRYNNKTLVSNQLIKGEGAVGAQRIPALKGGGVNPSTGKSLPYHFHIHKYNWYKPWNWFSKTPIIKP